jgi:hypothetical protein
MHAGAERLGERRSGWGAQAAAALPDALARAGAGAEHGPRAWLARWAARKGRARWAAGGAAGAVALGCG